MLVSSGLVYLEDAAFCAGICGGAMILNKSVQLVEVPGEIRKKALDFGKQVAITTDYRDHHQGNPSKVADDHFVGKMGEEAVRIVLEGLGNQVRGPDYTIYNGHGKSWDYDLFVSDVGIAVKTQRLRTARKHGMSWCFADSRTRRDPILDKPNGWVYFVLYVENSHFCYVFKPQKIRDIVFGEPALEHLLGHKKVAYLETIWRKKDDVVDERYSRNRI
jgi:hypothetical protein